jgi:Zn-dependent protease with chaperone function
MKILWNGQYLDGQTSTPQAAEIRLVKAGLKITTAHGGERIWPYSEIRQTQGHYAEEPVRLEWGGGIAETVTVTDADFLHSLRDKAGDEAGRFHNPGFRGTRLWLTVSAGLIALALSAAIYRWGIPALAESAANRVPVSWEESLGKSTLDQMVPAPTRIHSPTLDAAIAAIVAKLAGTVPQCPYHFQVTLCNQPIVNAFALPGGNIVVFRGLLEQTRSPEELAGVLAHEMQHVLKRHTTRRLIQQTSTGLLISVLSGDATGSVATGLQSAGTLMLMKYSRDEEAEADREGMKMILAAGIEPRGMIGFFQYLKAHDKMPQFLTFVSDHPATADRIEKLQQVVSAQAALAPLPKPQKLLPDTDWPALVKNLGPPPKSLPSL